MQLSSNPELAGMPLFHPMHPSLISASLPVKEWDWLKPVYDISKTTSTVDPKCGSAGPWDKGIRLNIASLRNSGVSEDWLVRLEHGFELALDEAPFIPSTPPENYSSILAYGPLAQVKCDEYLRAGVLKEIPAEEFSNGVSKFMFHPMGAVPKGLEDCRLIIDTSLTLLNRCIRDTVMKLHSYRVVLNACKPYYVIFGFDLSSGFHHLFIHLLHANLLCIVTPDGRKT